MQRIFKYPLKIEDRQVLMVPTGGLPRAVQWQGAQLCLWVEVNSEATPVPREFAIYGTGHPMPAYPGNYVGTFQMEGGSLVFHLYDTGST